MNTNSQLRLDGGTNAHTYTHTQTQSQTLEMQIYKVAAGGEFPVETLSDVLDLQTGSEGMQSFLYTFQTKDQYLLWKIDNNLTK